MQIEVVKTVTPELVEAFARYPLETARRLWQGGRGTVDFVLPTRRGWLGLRPTSEADWDECPYPWARGDAGLFISHSSDDGVTWDRIASAPIAPFKRGYSPRPPA